MMARKAKTSLSEKHKKILEVLETYTEKLGYPPSIRQICKEAGISSTSVANYYLDRLETMGYIERDRGISRGLRLVKSLAEIRETAQETIETIAESITELLSIPIIGQIVAGQPVPVPDSSFSQMHYEDMIDVASTLLPKKNTDKLFALEVSGDSMIDAMVYDGDIVIMQPPQEEIKDGDMVAVWLSDRAETTLKYIFRENGGVRLQPANPNVEPIYVGDAKTIEIQGKVMMVVRQMNKI